jgi:hypothetical protein
VLRHWQRVRQSGEDALRCCNNKAECAMAKVTYEILKHDGGWAYRVNETFSEPFRSHDEARHAALRAAREQHEPGKESALITWEDSAGHWHKEVAAGDDRPATDVKG